MKHIGSAHTHIKKLEVFHFISYLDIQPMYEIMPGWCSDFNKTNNAGQYSD